MVLYFNKRLIYYDYFYNYYFSSLNISDILSIDNLGYLEIMHISFISSIIIFVSVPYVPVLIAGAFNVQLDPHVISILTAISVTAGRTIIFMVSYYGYKILKEKTKNRFLCKDYYPDMDG